MDRLSFEDRRLLKLQRLCSYTLVAWLGSELTALGAGAGGAGAVGGTTGAVAGTAGTVGTGLGAAGEIAVDAAGPIAGSSAAAGSTLTTISEAAQLAAAGVGLGKLVGDAHAARPDEAIAAAQNQRLQSEQKRSADLSAEEAARRRVLESGKVGRGLLAFMPSSSSKQTTLGA